jgi:rhamnogalacturonan endolyase
MNTKEFVLGLSKLGLAAMTTTHAAALFAAAPVVVSQTAEDVSVQNGLIAITLRKADGSLSALRQCTARSCADLGQTSVRAAYEAPADDVANTLPRALYWDANAEPAHLPEGAHPDAKGYFHPRDGETEVSVVSVTAQRAEIAVKSAPTLEFPFEAVQHYVVSSGLSGIHVWVSLRHDTNQPAATLYQTRFVIRTVMDGTFSHWATGNGEFLPLPLSAVVEKLSDATFRLADGTVKTKYMQSVFWSEVPVYGYVGDHQGLWMIEPSPEYHNSGPTKQGQTLHDNILLRVLQSVHFGASPVVLADGEAWSKVYGPFLVYANHGNGHDKLWQDALRQYHTEQAAWPYAWVTDTGYAHARGGVTGSVRLDGRPPANTKLILTPAGTPWNEQNRSYAFWTQLGADGRFTLGKVIPGHYDLYLSGADQPQDFVRQDVQITANQTLDLGQLDWKPVRHGRTLWQLGHFDRSAGEFRNGSGARLFEMYKRYPAQFPADVDFTIGQSKENADWNYAQWTVFNQQPDWRVHFQALAPASGKATLTIGFASAQPAPRHKETDLRVSINGQEIAAIHLPKTGTAGYRGSVQDSPYHLRVIEFDSALLKPGENVLSLRHADAIPFAQASSQPGQVMYDALRLEVEPTGKTPQTD